MLRHWSPLVPNMSTDIRVHYTTYLPTYLLCILIEVLSLAQAKGKKVLNDFKFGIFIGRFANDDATYKHGSERVKDSDTSACVRWPSSPRTTSFTVDLFRYVCLLACGLLACGVAFLP